MRLNDVRLEGNNIRQISVVIIEIQAISDHKFVGNIESYVVDLHIARNWALFSEEDAGFDTGSPLLAEDGLDEPEGLAGVEDVVDEDDAAAMQIAELLGDDLGSLAGDALAGIAADGNDADPHGDGDLAHEIGAEDHCAGEDGDDGDLCRAVEFGDGVVFGDEPGQLGDASGDLLLGDEDAVDVAEHFGTM